MRILLLGAVVLLAAGCGSQPSGSKVFARQCAACHSLTGSERGTVGGDLAIPLLRVADLESFARAMPTPDRISAAEIHAVAVFIRDRERALRVR